jgi:site-specific DNA-methyltransferase (adenine-specific)
MSDYVLCNGDCLEELKSVPDKSVQLILTDLPYGTVKNTTACKWDDVIPMEKLWPEFERIIKDDGAIVLFSQQPFTSYLISSNLNLYKYNWIWKKNKYANFLNVRYQPGKLTEDICVFGKKGCSYTPNGNMKYNPQMAKGEPYKSKGKGNRGASSSVRGDLKQIPIDNKGERYPTNILEFSLDSEKLHPTQKPVELLRYLIRTYTDEGDTVLDATMGSGSTGVAAALENRDFYGIEKDENYFNIAKERIDKELEKQNGMGNESESDSCADSESAS